MKNKTTAQYLLDLIFEGHEIRYITDDEGRPHFVRNDIAKALGLSHLQKSINVHLDPDETGLTKVRVVEASGISRIRSFKTLTESGVLALVSASRKPAARRMRRWLTGEVIPQLIRYGSYIPGATVEDRLKSLYHRWKQERVEQLDQSQKEVAEAGLETISSFCKLVKVETRDILKFSGAVRKVAKVQGYTAERYFLNGRMTPAWPPQVLEQALVNFQPSLNLNSEKGGSN